MRVIILNDRGSALAAVVAVIALIGAMIPVYQKLNKKSVEAHDGEWDRFVAAEAAESGLNIMEAALDRRLWEPPPKADCTRELAFTASGETSSKIKFHVDVKFDPVHNIYILLGKGTYQGSMAGYRKVIKVKNASDYMVLSKSTSEAFFYGSKGLQGVASLIARHREIYFQGPLLLRPTYNRVLTRPLDDVDFNTNLQFGNPMEVKGVFQSERMTFRDGIGHYMTPGWRPNASIADNLKTPKLNSLLLSRTDHYPLSPTTNNTYYWNSSGGGFFFTSGLDRAQDIEKRVRENSNISSGLLTDQLYPRALTCGSTPINAASSNDSGCFVQNRRRWIPVVMEYGDEFYMDQDLDLLCYTQRSGTAFKNCSSSKDFPKGFASWRKSASLEGTVFSEEQEELKTTEMTWDHMEALEEDAKACGLVIDPAGGDSNADSNYRDCPLADLNFLQSYVTGSASCLDISTLDLSAVTTKISSLSSTSLSGERNLLARRVIYSKVPLEYSQTDENGILSSISNDDLRKKVSLWLVNEDVNIFKPYQSDMTGPIDSSPDRLRESYFNKSALGSTEPIQLLSLSPEQIVIHSPFHRPLTEVELGTDFTRSGGKIRPNYAAMTDWKHQEDDGFRYGARSINIGPLTIINNAETVPFSSPFFLRGLWSSVGQQGHKMLFNGCLLSGGSADPYGPRKTSMPAMGLGVTSPPASSRFYQPFVSGRGLAGVFEAQYNAARITKSRIIHEGTRASIYFENFTPTGKRNLGIPKYNWSDVGSADLFDLDQRFYIWNSSDWFSEVTSPTPCGTALSFLNGGGDLKLGQFINAGAYEYNLRSPNEEFSTGVFFASQFSLTRARGLR
jgi:hypothetical protein